MPVRKKRGRQRLTLHDLNIRQMLYLGIGRPRYTSEADFIEQGGQREWGSFDYFRRAWDAARKEYLDPPSEEKFASFHPGKRPGPWWTFDVPVEEWEREGETEIDALRRLGVLEPWECLCAWSAREELGDDFEQQPVPPPWTSWQERRETWEATRAKLLAGRGRWWTNDGGWYESQQAIGGQIDYDGETRWGDLERLVSREE